MGSMEEEQLLQMVHDFIESESTSSSSSSLPPNYYNSSSNKKHLRHHSTRYFTLQEILKDKTGEERRIQEKVGKYMKNKLDIEKTTGLKQWIVKCLLLDGFNASLVHTSWVTTPSCPCGSYEFIETVEEDHENGGLMAIKVDIDFKSQFEIARPTQSYKELLKKLPSIFVGREAKLNTIITLLCSAAQESLREQGLHIPPWRRPTYMQSKWNLTNYNCSNDQDHDMDYNGNNHGYLVDHKAKTAVKMNNGRTSRQVGFGGSGLSNQFSKMSINCC